MRRKSTTFIYPSDYISDLPPTLSTFDLLKIPVPPSAVVKDLSSAIILQIGLPDIMTSRSKEFKKITRQVTFLTLL
jgi:hypothetical protein